MGTHNDNKKAGIPTTTGIPASIQADYRGNFGLDQLSPPLNRLEHERHLRHRTGTLDQLSGVRPCRIDCPDHPELVVARGGLPRNDAPPQTLRSAV